MSGSYGNIQILDIISKTNFYQLYIIHIKSTINIFTFTFFQVISSERLVNVLIISWHRSYLPKVNISLKIDHYSEKKTFFFLFKAYLLLSRNVNRILWDDILWILFYILWLCENWKFSPTTCPAGWLNKPHLIYLKWIQFNSAWPKICFHSSKTCNHPKVHCHCSYCWGKYTLIEKTVQCVFWKIKWPSLVHNLVRRLMKVGRSKVTVLELALQITCIFKCQDFDNSNKHLNSTYISNLFVAGGQDKNQLWSKVNLQQIILLLKNK